MGDESRSASSVQDGGRLNKSCAAQSSLGQSHRRDETGEVVSCLPALSGFGDASAASGPARAAQVWEWTYNAGARSIFGWGSNQGKVGDGPFSRRRSEFSSHGMGNMG